MNRRFQKMFYLAVSKTAGRYRIKTYYWCEKHLYPLRAVVILPVFFYRGLFSAGMAMLKVRRLHRIANWLVHRIPYQVRFQLA